MLPVPFWLFTDDIRARLHRPYTIKDQIPSVLPEMRIFDGLS
jgi:hypothetical protein